jgi:site-specific DNA recombinase
MGHRLRKRTRALNTRGNLVRLRRVNIRKYGTGRLETKGSFPRPRVICSEASIARGRRWLEELIAGATATLESIAKREKCSIRKANMTISLAFLAPDLVKAAIEGRLPHGMGLARLADLPAEWSRQHRILGLPAQ